MAYLSDRENNCPLNTPFNFSQEMEWPDLTPVEEIPKWFFTTYQPYLTSRTWQTLLSFPSCMKLYRRSSLDDQFSYQHLLNTLTVKQQRMLFANCLRQLSVGLAHLQRPGWGAWLHQWGLQDHSKHLADSLNFGHRNNLDFNGYQSVVPY